MADPKLPQPPGMDPRQDPELDPEMDMEDDELATEEEQDLFDNIVASGLEYLAGAARDGVVKILTEEAPDSIPERIAQIIYRVLGPAVQELTEAGVVIDVEMMFGAATELIDAAFEMAGALAVADGEDQDAKAATLFALVTLYMQDADTSDEARAAAKAELAELMNGPDAAGAIDYVKGAIERTGGNPAASFQQGEAMAQGMQQDPVQETAAGVKRGLMGEEQP